jgi:hypothetical protein
MDAINANLEEAALLGLNENECFAVIAPDGRLLRPFVGGSLADARAFLGSCTPGCWVQICVWTPDPRSILTGGEWVPTVW